MDTAGGRVGITRCADCKRVAVSLAAGRGRAEGEVYMLAGAVLRERSRQDTYWERRREREADDERQEARHARADGRELLARLARELVLSEAEAA